MPPRVTPHPLSGLVLDDASATAVLAPIIDRLTTPLVELPVDRAWPLWREATISLTCPRPPDLDTGPSLPGRLRGAMGRALASMPPRNDGLPRAFDLLFHDGPATRHLRTWPRPYVLATDMTDRGLVVHLRMFGWAIAWLEEVVPALFAGLEAGLSLSSGARARARLEPVERQATLVQAADPPPATADAVVLRFKTPLVLERQGALRVEGGALVRSIIRRVAGMAAWMDIALAGARAGGSGANSPAPAAGAALGALADAVAVAEETLRPVTWTRFSAAQNQRAIPMSGVIGSLRLTGPLSPLLPWLHLGQRCHAGRRPAFGLGRYDLYVEGG